MIGSHKTNEVVVYTSMSCPFCERAKRLLKSKSVSFREVLIGWEDDLSWEQLFHLSGMKTVPQIFVGEKLIGGFDELSHLAVSDPDLNSLKK